MPSQSAYGTVPAANHHADPELLYVKQNRIGRSIMLGDTYLTLMGCGVGKGSFGEVYKG